MPLHLIRAADNQRLWGVCADRFLEGVSSEVGPTGHGAWMWLSHRSLRDMLFEAAADRGLRGWLRPPVTLLADLPRLFEVRDPAAGLLTRRRLLSRLAARLGREMLGRRDGGSGADGAGGLVRAHMLDGLFADLLPEGVSPEELERALELARAERGGGDAFVEGRDRWIVAVYRRYLAELEARGERDWRSVRALVVDRIERGGLLEALGGARALHIYGLANPRTFRRLLRALADQREVEVFLYQPAEPEESELEALAERVEDLTGRPPPALRVQPAPDAAREMEWVARRVKRLLTEHGVEPHRVAVVARSGHEDTRRAYRALTRAGVPCSARIRTRLSEIAALRAMLLLFRGAARDWDYSSLRAVLEHRYFDTGVDLRSIDFLATRSRIRGLDAWEERLEALRPLVEENDPSTWSAGLFADRVAADLEAFRTVRATLQPLSESRREGEWLRLSLAFLREERGVFFLRRRLCDPVDDRWEVVRQDQRGVVQLERLLHEWLELDHAEEPLSPAEWHGLLSRMLEANELVLSTPQQKGVQVLEAHDAALVPFEHVFLVHANDGEFPRGARVTGVLDDEERARLFAAGVPLAHRHEALRRERRLWRAVAQQAAPVHVTYRTTDAQGTPLLPSLLVPSHDPGAELPRTRRPPEESHPVSEPEADRRAADRLHRLVGREGADRADVAPARPELLRHAVLAAVAEWHRGAGRERTADREAHISLRPNPWNGQWRDPALLAWLERKFDAEYPWSAGQLELYARAPFAFLVQRVLKLEEAAEAEEETTPLTFGSIAHSVLERFYGRLLPDGSGGETRSGPAELGDRRGRLPRMLTEGAAELLDRTLEQVCAEEESRGKWLGLPSLWEATRQDVRRKLREYVDWELRHLAESGEVPARVELEFGFDPPLHIDGTDVHGRPATLRLRGRIDRVDRQGEGEAAVHHVLDYKSSAVPSRGGYEDGCTLQGALYLRALQELGMSVGKARYRVIKKPGDPTNGCEIKADSKWYDAAIPLALSIPARVRSGLFEAVAARRGKWLWYDPGPGIRRNEASIAEGHRFERPSDEIAELPADGVTTAGAREREVRDA